MQSETSSVVDSEVLYADPLPEPKPGYLTSEFHGKCAVQLVAILVLVGIIPTADQAHSSEIALALIGAVEGFYAHARGLAKKRA